MISVAESVLRWGLLRFPPEVAHHLALQALSTASRVPGVLGLLGDFSPSDSPVSVCGVSFRNRLGLAAGYDKDARAVVGLAGLGFGHLELGTVVPRAQEGNPGRRIVRLRPEHALVNRLGFPSRGLSSFCDALDGVDVGPCRIGANLGKNRDTPNGEAREDYVQGLRATAPLVDYVALNISSPNTKGLRELSEIRILSELVEDVVRVRDELPRRVPVWVKLSPDDPALADVARCCEAAGADALIVSNTTVARPVPSTAVGGLSGPPLADLSLRALVEVRAACDLPLVAVGGIHDRAGYVRRLEAGASLCQIYTAMVYGGIGVLRQIAG